MEIKVNDQRENKLLHRKEIQLTVEYSGSRTPSREELKEEACKKLSLHPELTEIIYIDQLYGSNSCNAQIHSYSKKEAMEMLSPSRQKAAKEAKQKPEPAKEEAKK